MKENTNLKNNLSIFRITLWSSLVFFELYLIFMIDFPDVVNGIPKYYLFLFMFDVLLVFIAICYLPLSYYYSLVEKGKTEAEMIAIFKKITIRAVLCAVIPIAVIKIIFSFV